MQENVQFFSYINDKKIYLVILVTNSEFRKFTKKVNHNVT